MHDSDFDPDMQIKDVDATLKRLERQAVVVLISILVLAVTSYSLLLGMLF